MTQRFHWAYQWLLSWMLSDSWGSSGLKEHRQSQILALCFPLSHHLSLPAPHYHSCGQQPVSVGRKVAYQHELSAHRTWNNWSMEDTTLSCKINVWSLQVCLQFEYNLRGRPLWLVFWVWFGFKTAISWSEFRMAPAIVYSDFREHIDVIKGDGLFIKLFHKPVNVSIRCSI